MKNIRKIINALIILLLIFQLFGYVSNLNKEADKSRDIQLVGYFIGFNLPLIISIILFLISRYIKRKLCQKENTQIIDSIGKNNN